MNPDTQLGGEFFLKYADKNCENKPGLRVPKQYEFEKAIVEKRIKAARKEEGRGKNPNSVRNLKPFSR